MVRIIKEIKEAAKEVKDGKCMLVYQRGSKTLELYERKGKGIVLPAGVKNKCWGSLETSSGQSISVSGVVQNS